MEIITAEVRDNYDITRTGMIAVTHPSLKENILVIYTSPYLAGYHGGFIAIPEVGSKVLIVKPDGGDVWYYMSTVVSPAPGAAISDSDTLDVNRPAYLPDDKVYKAKNVPERLVLKSARGHGLTLSDERNESYVNSKAQLRSGNGKRLELVDSPEIDAIILRNEHGDRIKITSTTNGISAGRAIEIECTGPLNVISRESTMNIKVVDGKELNIINSSTGGKRIGPTDSTPGNINITSDHNDIYIKAKADDSAIFVEAVGANASVEITAGKNINLIAGDSLNIQAGTVGIQSTSGPIVIESADTIELNT